MLFGVYAGIVLIYIIESNNKYRINFRDSTYVNLYVIYIVYIYPSNIIILQFDGSDISSFAQGFALSGFPSRIGFWFQVAAVLETFGELDSTAKIKTCNSSFTMVPELIDSGELNRPCFFIAPWEDCP